MANKPNMKKGPGRLPSRNRPSYNNNVWLWLLITLTFLMMLSQANLSVVNVPRELPYSEFYSILKDNPQTEKIKSLSMTENILQGVFSDGGKFTVNIPEKDDVLLG